MTKNTQQIMKEENPIKDSKSEKNSKIKSKNKKISKSNNSSRVKGKHPLEIEYWFVLPAIRRELALRLVERNLKQREIAKIVGMTEAAVSQYIKRNRGRLTIKDGNTEIDIELPDWLKREIETSSELIYDDRSEPIFIKETNRIMQIIRSKPREFLCGVHESLGEKVDDCEVCFTGIVIETH